MRCPNTAGPPTTQVRVLHVECHLGDAAKAWVFGSASHLQSDGRRFEIATHGHADWTQATGLR